MAVLRSCLNRSPFMFVSLDGGVRLTHSRNQFAMRGFGVRAVLARLLLLDLESEAGPRPHLLHLEPLELGTLETAVFEQTPAGTQEHRHHVEAKLIDQTSPQQLLYDADATDYLNRLVAGGGSRLRDGRFDAVGHEGEGEVFVLLGLHAWWTVSHHEYGRLKLVVADVPIGILRHLERPPPHENGTGLCDQGIHVGRALEGRKVRLETLDAAALIGDEPVDRSGHPGYHFCHGMIPVKRARRSPSVRRASMERSSSIPALRLSSSRAGERSYGMSSIATDAWKGRSSCCAPAR